MLRRLLLVPVLLTVSSWAAAINAPGVPNFFQVDERLYRGAQPTAEGLKSLQKLGIKTIVDLRGPDSSLEKKEVEALGMKYVSVPLRGLTAPTDQEMEKVLKLLEPAASTGWPVFVHCRRGKDRTGTVVACYRIAHDGWKNGKALAEAREHGMSLIERAMMHYILNFTPPKDLELNKAP